jgi:hypothetical protein
MPTAESDSSTGTFHSTCVKYLRKYGKRIGLNNNFSIIDQDDAYVWRLCNPNFTLIFLRSKKLVSDFLKPIAQGLKEAHTPLKAQQVLSDISNAKAKSESPAGMRIRAQSLGSGGQILMVIADVSRRSPMLKTPSSSSSASSYTSSMKKHSESSEVSTLMISWSTDSVCSAKSLESSQTSNTSWLMSFR